MRRALMRYLSPQLSVLAITALLPVILSPVITAENHDEIAVFIENKTYKVGSPAVDFAHKQTRLLLTHQTERRLVCQSVVQIRYWNRSDYVPKGSSRRLGDPADKRQRLAHTVSRSQARITHHDPGPRAHV